MEVRLRDVWHSYDGVRYVLRNVNVTFDTPGMYVVLGPNGSGKTTLLKITSLMIRPSRGDVYVNGLNYWSLGNGDRGWVRRSIVYVHDRPIMLRGSVEYNVCVALKTRGVVDCGEVVYEYMRRYGILDIGRRSASKISAGQAKLVSILRAMVLRPPALVLDEPFTFLDRERVQTLMEDLRDLARDGLVIVSTHYLHRDLIECSRNVIELTLL